MTSALAILERSFRRIEIPSYMPPLHRPRLCGVYALITETGISYVGSSIDVIGRLWFHRRTKTGFDGAIWIQLPDRAKLYYEGALIRYLQPEHNKRGGPGNCGYDAEILYGLGLRDDLATDDIAWQEVA